MNFEFFNHIVRHFVGVGAVGIDKCAFKLAIFGRNSVQNTAIGGVGHAFKTIKINNFKLIGAQRLPNGVAT